MVRPTLGPTPRDITNQTVSLLGGAKTLGVKPRHSRDWVCLIRKGFPPSSLDSLGLNVGVTNADLAQVLGISVRALATRRRKMVLSPYESERLLRLARVVARSDEVFGDLGEGVVWLKSPNAAQDGATPWSLLDTYVGFDCVMEMLGRIEHGVFA